MSSGGGGGDVPANRSQFSTTETIVPDWVASQIAQNIQTSNELAAQPFQQPPAQLAGFTPDQLAAFQAVRSMQGTAPGQIGTATSSIANLPATIANLWNPYTAGQESTALQNALRQMAMTRMQIGANAAKQGTLGGTREAIDLAMATSGTQAGLGRTIAGISSDAWMKATQDAFRQAGLTSDLATAQQLEALQAAGALNQVGGAAQTLQQAQYSQHLQQWQVAQNWPYQQLAIDQSALAGSPYGTTVRGAQPYSSSGGASTLGMIASMIPILAGLPGAVKTIGGGAAWLGSALGLGGAATDAAGAAGAASYAAELGFGADAAFGAGAAGAGADAALGAGAAGGAAAGKGAADVAPFVVAAAA